ncbi:MAG: serine hydrolase domain-containing protein [Myxococcota bacterium]
MPDAPRIHGFCAPRFAALRAALEANFREHGEVGAALAVTVDGELVVDLWAGWLDEARARPWRRETLVNVFSVGKAVATLAVLMLVERALLALDAPVARYWPEFARADKGAITVRMVLGHRAGLPAIRQPLSDDAIYDWKRMTEALAAETPYWEPGRRHGYHVNTFGFLVGELVRRVTGESIGAFVRREIAGPLGADFHFGVSPENQERVGDFLPGVLFGGEAREAPPTDAEHAELLLRVYANPRGISGMGTVNTERWRAAELPSTNGHANARAVARIYSALAGGGEVGGTRLLRRETIEEATREVSAGEDFVLRRATRFGLGFQLWMPERRFSASERSFGHFGAGGSLGFADPDARLAFGYTMNRGGPRWQNPRVRGLLGAVESVADVRG